MLSDQIPVLKRRLADEILAVASQTNMHIAARALGIDVPRMSDLRAGRIARFSVERLIRILARIDRRVEMRVVVTGPAQVRWFATLPARPRRQSDGGEESARKRRG